MLNLRTKYVCNMCGHGKVGVNVKTCSECGSEELSPEVTLDDLCILPKVMEMAESNDLDASSVLAQASFRQAFAIIQEAMGLLSVISSGKIRLAESDIDVLLKNGQEVGEFAKSITVVKRYAIK